MPRAQALALPLMFALLAAILAALYAISRSDGERSRDVRAFPFQLEDVIAARITPKLPFFVADVDLDGNDDLLINEPSRLLWYRLRGKEMSLAGEAAYERPGSTRMVTDANGDGHPDFFVLTRSHEGAMVSCHDWFAHEGPSAPLYAIGPLLLPTECEEDPWRRIDIFGSYTPKNDAHPEILISLTPKKSGGAPRSLFAYDGVTGDRIWSFRFMPSCWEAVCRDLGGEAPRVYLSTLGGGSKSSYNGMADSVASIFCLDSRDGSRLWQKQVGGVGGRSTFAFADINGDGQSEILVARSLGVRDFHLMGKGSSWTVMALDRDGAVLDTVPLGMRTRSIHAVDLDGGPALEILVVGLSGTIVIFNHDLTIRRVIEAPPHVGSWNPDIFGVWDLDGDGKREIICRQDSMLVVRDHEGTPIAQRMFAYEFSARLARYDGRSFVVAARGDSIHVMELKRTPLAARLRAHASGTTIAETVAVVFLAGAGGFHFRRYLKRRREKNIAFDEAQSDLLTAMSAFGHGGSSLRVIDRIRLHLKNWDRVQSDAAARDELFARLNATFMETVMPELKHIVMLAHKARVPEERWGAIMPRAALAGREMEAILAAGSEGAVAVREPHVAGALAALGDVDESVAGIRSYLRSIFRTPVVEALERVVARFRDEHAGTGINLVLPSDASAEEGVFISSVAFDKVFEALLTNSARATEVRTDAAIEIEVRWEGNYCTIDTRDNGCGIPREDWERAFERSYTTKKAGGFGLHYAHETLARFGGKIFVFDSAVGSGTTMRIVLRKS